MNLKNNARPSPPQRVLLAQMRAGALLQWLSGTRRYSLVNRDRVRTIEPRTVDALVAGGWLEKDLLGECRLSAISEWGELG